MFFFKETYSDVYSKESNSWIHSIGFKHFLTHTITK